MPKNNKIIKYVLGFKNSNYILNDFQYNEYENVKYAYCSKFHLYDFKTLNEAKNFFIALKNKAKTISGFYFYSIDDYYSSDENVDNMTDDNFHIELPNEEEGCYGMKYLKLPQTLDDLKIFSREVEVTYTEVTEDNG